MNRASDTAQPTIPQSLHRSPSVWGGLSAGSRPPGRLVFALALAAILLPAADWPTFRGPNASGVAEGPAPTTWDATKNENVLWKTPIPGRAHSSPVVSGNKVYITT